MKDRPGERLEMIVQKNGNSPELFQKLLNYFEQIFVPCKQVTPKTEQSQEDTEIKEERVKERSMANSAKCSQEVKKAKDWNKQMDLVTWKALMTCKEAVSLGERSWVEGRREWMGSPRTRRAQEGLGSWPGDTE